MNVSRLRGVAAASIAVVSMLGVGYAVAASPDPVPPPPVPSPAEEQAAAEVAIAARATAANARAAASCSPGSSYYTVARTAQTGEVITHLLKVPLDADRSFAFDSAVDRLPEVRRLTAGAKGEGRFSASAILRQVAAAYEDTPYQRPGASTRTDPDDTGGFRTSGPAEPETLGLVAWKGAVASTGTWTRTKCGAKKAADRGTWTTFRETSDGIVACDVPDEWRVTPSEACRRTWNRPTAA